MPRGKCNLYDIGCEVALSVRWPGYVPPGRTVTDLVNLMDLAPTVLEAADVEVPETMTARSLLNVLQSDQEGRVDQNRNFVVTGRERHVEDAREGFLPYPQRALRTDDWLYIRNFAPDRWPMGDPKGLDDPDTPPPDYEELATNTRAVYADLDASPTKAWMIHHRAQEDLREIYELGFGKRPAEELYDLRTDPNHMHNLADDRQHAATRQELSERLMEILKAQNDPRVVETPCRFEHAPYAGPVTD
jgi:arylsulfatase A-like enzyme